MPPLCIAAAKMNMNWVHGKRVLVTALLPIFVIHHNERN